MFSVTGGKWSTTWEQKTCFLYLVDRLGRSVHYYRSARFCLFLAFFDYTTTEEQLMKKVAVIMGSDSDLPVVRKATDILSEFGVPFEVRVLSAHRTPLEAAEFARSARDNGFGVIIAAAGMAAHLAGAFAANTTLPVIGIPIKSKYLDGVDALLSTVQMPTGMPVATVAIDGAANAALLSIQMLAICDEELQKKYDAYRAEATAKVLDKDRALQSEFGL